MEELNKIPVLVELRRLKSGVSITDLICADIVKKAPSAPAAERLMAALRDGNFIIFLDGYDEIQDELKSSVSEEILRISSDFRYCNFVLTSRREVALSGFPEFFWYHISRLSAEKSLSLLRRYDKNRGVADRLWAKASVIEEISDFLETPLLLTLLYKAFDYKSVVPIKRATFYRKVFDALYQDHDLSKEGFFERRKKSSLDLDDFHKVMRRVGLDCVRRGEVQFSSEQFHELLVGAVASSGVSADPAKLKNDLISAVPLFVKDGAEYRWSHKSFADYFAATCVWMDLGSDRKNIVSAMFNSNRCEKYSASLRIICELDEGLVIDNCVVPYLEKVAPDSLFDSDEDNYYFSIVDRVAKLYMVVGEYSIDEPEKCFKRLDDEVIGKNKLSGYSSWRITWGLSEGKIMYVAVNDEFARLNVLAEILGLSNSPRARRVPIALYEKLSGTVCLNDYLKAVPVGERADVLIAIRQGMTPARIPSLPVATKIVADASARRNKPEVSGEW